MNKAKEKILLARIQQQQDTQAFGQFYETLVDPIYRFVFFKVSHTELAQDLTSETFLRAWRGLTSPSAIPIRHLRAYVYQTARSLVIDHYRKGAKWREESLDAAAGLMGDVDVHRRAEFLLEAQELFTYIQRLKESYQEILLLKYVEDLSLTEIAPIMGKSPVATRVLLHRAHKALKREYDLIASTTETKL